MPTIGDTLETTTNPPAPCLPKPIVVPVVTKQNKSTKLTIDLRKHIHTPNTQQRNAKLNHKPILKTHSFEQTHKPFRIPEALHLPQLDQPPTHKAMFTESKVKKYFNKTHQAYADSGTDIHITNPQTVTELNLQRHPYTKPVTIQFGDGSLQCATHFVFMGDILGEVPPGTLST